jgi:hypothetical protein
MSIPPVIVAYFAPFSLADSRSMTEENARPAVQWAAHGE